ncbi:2,4'-dihydroxyacetophenone dioxygenase family protein [Variovorax sp. LARHSF232]
MLHEQIRTSVINDESIPWVPFTPHSSEVLVKYFKADPIRGETILLIKATAGTRLPTHHHSGTVLTYTIQGSWKCREHDWIAGPGSVVFEPAASSRTPQVLANSCDLITLNIVAGDLIFVDDDGQVLGIENWKTGLERYLAYCRTADIEPSDITAFN